MDGVSLASGIAGLITLALQVSTVIADFAIAVKEGPQNIKELHQELFLLGEILSQLQDFLRSEKVKGRSFDGNSVMQSAISSCKVRIERIGDKLKPSVGGKMSRLADRLRWPFESKEVEKMVANLRSYTQAFQFSVTIEGCNLLAKNTEEATNGLQVMLETSKKIHELSLQMGSLTVTAEESAKKSAQLEQVIQSIPLFQETAAEVQEISHSMRIAELREQERRTTEILEWLTPITSLQKHSDAQAKRSPGTGEWFLHSEELVGWTNGQSQQHDVLCIGGPGVGKTVLTSLVIDKLRSKYKGQDVGIAYFYCEYSEQESQTALSFACSLLRQLSSQCGLAPAVLTEFYRKTKNNIKDQAWSIELQDVLYRVASTFIQCYVVVDALDECDAIHRSGLFGVLTSFRRRVNTRVFASTRPHLPNIEQYFKDAVQIEVTASDSDLQTFLSRLIDEHPDSEYIMDDALKTELLNKLCANARGIFLLPALQIKEILDQVTKSDVRRALRNLSTDINKAFQSTIDRIKGQSANRRNLAFRTLMFISYAKRNLTIDELRHALAVRMEDDDLDRDNLLSLKTILDSCNGLVEVAESSKLRLVHFTLEEYLRSDHGFFENGDLEITKVCFRYMTLTPLKNLPWINRNDFERALADFPFLNYASFEFGYHARDLSVDQVRDLALSFFNSKPHLLTVARVRDSKAPDFRKWKEKMTTWALSGGAAISLAASFGMTNFVKFLLDQTEERIWARNVYGSTALHEACLKGYEDTAEVLIANGADLFDSNAGKNTSLYLAVAYNRISMVKSLLKYGHEQVNIICRGGWTALINAADLANEEMVMLLLQAGADHSIRNDRGMTALHLAARKNHTGVVKLLILAGASIDVKNLDGLSPLALATTGGHLETATVLLDNGAAINQTGMDRWAQLHRAARGGWKETVALLIERGADLMVIDGKGNLPLHLAARSGHIETVDLILNSRAERRRDQLLAKDRKGSTPRMIAFYTAHYDVHRLLRAAEIEILGTDELASADKLTVAIEEGQYSIVCRLLNKSETKIDEPDNNGQPPLHVAIQEERLDIAELLIEHGAAIESLGYHNWRPLHVASSIGSVPLVNMCLRNGADVHALTSTEQTPLHKACSSKSVEVVRMLLEAGAHPEAMNHRGMRAIHVACHQNQREIVELLVREWHVDLFARDTFGDSAADWCERSGHLELLRFMREEEKKSRVAGQRTSSGAIRSIEYESS